jgi:ATP-binding cassette subfamily C (CFTR/MRP) protein 1
LKQLTFQVLPGTKIGIVGRTGAGKSTICISMSRIVELLEGKVEIDGVDIAQIDLQKLREKVTVIPQDPTLFTGSLRFNLDPFDTVTDEKILMLLNEAGLSDLLARSDNADADERGINMKITEGGKNLSAGERQLICICRAILRKNRIVVLDEATANIDVITEQKIQRLIDAEFKGSTVVTIAHRLNTIIRSDYVLVLSRGQLVEYDTP